MKSIYSILSLILTVLIGAVADGLNLIGPEWLGHLLEGAELVFAMAAALSMSLSVRDEFYLLKGKYLIRFVLSRFAILVLCWAFIRFALFDYTLNFVTGQEWTHLNEDVWPDMIIMKWPPVPVLIARVVFFTAGIAIPIKELR